MLPRFLCPRGGECRIGSGFVLEAGKPQHQLGQPEEALATFERGLAEIRPDDAVRAFVLSRQAAVHEDQGQYAEAAAAYEQAAAVTAYPLRFDALADAARTWAQAGDRERALAAYARIEAEAPDYRVAPYIEARLDHAGWQGGELFSEGALEVIHRLSGGFPRPANRICERALTQAARWQSVVRRAPAGVRTRPLRLRCEMKEGRRPLGRR